MRVTQKTFFDQYSNRQTASVEKLNATYEQITTAKQISHGYQDSIKLVNTLNLNTQEAFFTQVNKIAEQALTFSRDTDNALGEFQDTLVQFKQKLIDAGNGNHSITSLNSIARELELLITHLRDTANTSINRNFLFAGSNLTERPIDDNLEYHGNQDTLNILLGRSESQSGYNVNGYELFYGKDSDYNKVISSNIKHYNKTLLNPDIMTKDLKDELSQQVFVNASNQIRDLVGDNDDEALNDKKAIFYVRGQNTAGDLIKAKLTLDSGDKVSTLLKKVEDLYDGFVTAEMNEDGQFRLTSKIKGSDNIDFHMFAAVDRNSEVAENRADVDDISELTQHEDIDIVEFVYSGLSTIKTESTIISRPDIFDNKTIYLKSSFAKSDGSEISLNDKLVDLLDHELTSLNFKGTDVDGNDFDHTVQIDAQTDVRSFFDEVQSVFSGGSDAKRVAVSFLNDKLIIQENLTNQNAKTQTALNVSITANEGNLKAFSGIEAMNIDRVAFSKDKNTLTSLLSQLDKDEKYATRNTKLSSVAQANLQDTTFELDITTIQGNRKKVQIDLKSDHASFSVDGKEYDIVNENLFYISSGSTHDRINTPESYDLEGIRVGDKIRINGAERTITAIDPQYKYIDLDATLDVNFVSGDEIEFIDPPYKRTTHENMTYGQLMDIIGMTMSESLPQASNDKFAYQEAIDKYEKSLDISLDVRGKLTVVDKVESLSKIELAMYDVKSNDFSNNSAPTLIFNANNAVVIDTPSTDFFGTLTSAVTAVENGILTTDAYSQDSRSAGIRGAIRAIDHLAGHVAKVRTVAGTNSQSIDTTIKRLNNTITTTKELKNNVIATDVAETMVKFNEQALNYSALLRIISQINELTLINYYQ